MKKSALQMAVSTLALIFTLGSASQAAADEADAKELLKAMTDYLEAQELISFDYDATLQVVTTEDQILALAASGVMTFNRPDMLHVTRSGGFADVEMFFDGKTVTMLGKNVNLYTQIDASGTIDQLVDVLRNDYSKPLPAADLILSNAYDELMSGVIDIKDLGSGVIDGVECDTLAFRTEEVDWQIWIAHGDRQYPCRFDITSKQVAGSPQYSIQFRDWKTGDAVTDREFSFTNPTNAEKVEIDEIDELSDMPNNFTTGAN